MDAQLLKQLKDLHKIAFGDSDLYIDFFFEKRFTRDNFFYKKIDGEIAGVVYARLMEFSITNSLHPKPSVLHLPFLTGIATHPNFRYKGIAKELIDQTIEEYGKRGYPLVLLSPFNEEFYKNLGFTTVTYVERVKIDYEMSDNLFAKLIDFSLLDIVKNIYDSVAKEHENHRVRTPEEFKNIWQAHSQDGGLGYLIYENETPKAYFFCEEQTITEYISPAKNLIFHIPEAANKTCLFLSNSGEAHIMAKPAKNFNLTDFNVFLYEKY